MFKLSSVKMSEDLQKNSYEFKQMLWICFNILKEKTGFPLMLLQILKVYLSIKPNNYPFTGS